MAINTKKRPAEDEYNEPKPIVAPPAIEQQVLKLLGTPPEFYKCQVVNVGDQRWRANVRVYVPSNDTVRVSKIAHSYYLKTDDSGNITNKDIIQKVY